MSALLTKFGEKQPYAQIAMGKASQMARTPEDGLASHP